MIVDAFTRHKDSTFVVRPACCALDSLECFEALVDILTRYMDSAVVVEQACRAIGKMSLNDDNRVKLPSLGFCEALVDVITRHKDGKDVVEQACRAIGKISINDNNRVKHAYNLRLLDIWKYIVIVATISFVIYAFSIITI